MNRDARSDPRVAALLSEANVQPEGPRRMFLLEQAINIADVLGDLRAGWDLRIRLMSDAEMSGYGDRTIVALAWCLGLADKDPETFDAERVLWQLKWVAPGTAAYPSIPRAVIMGMLDEMERRYKAAGWGMRGVYHKRMSVHWSLGDLDEVKRYMALWQATPRDFGSDCLACERDQLVDLYTLFGEPARAVREARPLVESRQSCSHVPQRTYSKLTFPNWALGNHREALEMQRRGVKATRNGLEFLTQAGEHALFAACVGRAEEALGVLGRRVPDVERTPEESIRLEFLQNAAGAVRALRALGYAEGEALAAVKAPGLAPTMSLEAWEGYLTGRAEALGARFDARAGNGYRAGRLREALARAAEAPGMAAVAAGLERNPPGQGL